MSAKQILFGDEVRARILKGVVAREIELEEPFENLGAQMAREVASIAGLALTTDVMIARLPARGEGPGARVPEDAY